MKIEEIGKYCSAEVLCGKEDLDREVYSACCSDMMSDVLAFVKDQGVLITGLVNTQVIRTAAMMDMMCVLFIRNKVPTEEMIKLAEECGIVVMRSGLRAYEACGVLYSKGLIGNKEETA